jgi:hypothetical protein
VACIDSKAWTRCIFHSKNRSRRTGIHSGTFTLYVRLAHTLNVERANRYDVHVYVRHSIS